MVLAAGIGMSTGPIIMAYFMSSIGYHAFFLGIAVAFALITVVVLSSMVKRSLQLEDPEDQAPTLAAGPIGSPIRNRSLNTPIHTKKRCLSWRFGRL